MKRPDVFQDSFAKAIEGTSKCRFPRKNYLKEYKEKPSASKKKLSWFILLKGILALGAKNFFKYWDLEKPQLQAH